MKNKISFLTAVVVMLGINYASASECVDDDCELSPVVIEENIETVDFLEPKETSDSIWATQYVDKSQEVCEYDYNCPFSTEQECDIWYKKPVYKESVAPREPRINPIKMDDILYAVSVSCDVSANDPVFAPLVERYKMLMRASKSCCSEGILYKMRLQKASDKKIYNFLKDDANYFAVGTRCLVMDNYDISPKYSNGVNDDMIIDVRNTCLCKNRQWFDSLLAPFNDIYATVPEFKSKAFNYTYVDGMHRNITVSVNEDVQTALNMLSNCPD